MQYTLITLPNVDPNKPGLYEWRVGFACYIGKYFRPSRVNDYRHQVRRLLEGVPYRKVGRDYRPIHWRLAAAVRCNQPITLTLLSNNCNLERHYIDQRKMDPELVCYNI